MCLPSDEGIKKRRLKMKFKVSFDMDNAAFEPDARTGEIARILRELADKMELRSFVTKREAGSIRDINGNTVGEWKIT